MKDIDNSAKLYNRFLYAAISILRFLKTALEENKRPAYLEPEITRGKRNCHKTIPHKLASVAVGKTKSFACTTELDRQRPFHSSLTRV